MTSTIYNDDKAHMFRSWSAQKNQSPIVVVGGEGAWYWDEQGNKYLDYCSQRVNLNLGHQHPRLVNTLKQQADKLSALSQIHASEPRSTAAKLIAERAPGDLNKIFFTNSGTDAVEHAVRMAKFHTQRNKVFTMHRSYHGSTAAAMSYTGDPRRWAAEPGIPGVVRFFGPYLYRSSFAANSAEEECEKSLAHLEELLMYENPKTVAAIMLETVVGTNGLLPPPDGYLKGIREICDRHGIVMICDEVMCGFGRCGEWFAVNRWGVVPDLITFAKGVNSGYVPLGGIVISDRVAATFNEQVFQGGGTYYGHPLACAVAVESIRVFEETQLLQRVRQIGVDIFSPRLSEMVERHACVGDVRGMGCFWALELVKNRRTREMMVPFNAKGESKLPMKKLGKLLQERGLSVLIHDNRLHLCPPLITSDEDLHFGLDIVDDALGEMDTDVR